ncbi:MAG TPA: hypothetical protein VGX28_02215 [Frankiaceae bacterium]|jgi:hypothetical protein|nr:hypothetical protein [Frankiaceae bacterium]
MVVLLAACSSNGSEQEERPNAPGDRLAAPMPSTAPPSEPASNASPTDDASAAVPTNISERLGIDDACDLTDEIAVTLLGQVENGPTPSEAQCTLEHPDLEGTFVAVHIYNQSGSDALNQPYEVTRRNMAVMVDQVNGTEAQASIKDLDSLGDNGFVVTQQRGTVRAVNVAWEQDGLVFEVRCMASTTSICELEEVVEAAGFLSEWLTQA